MPYDDPDPTDPMTLHGVAIQTDDEGAMVEMAECFIEEYMRMGFSAERLTRLFENPAYAGPNLAYRLLGAHRVSSMIEVRACLRRRATPGREPAQIASNGVIPLKVLD